AHENPVIFYSCVLGVIGPVLAIGVPPFRKSFGWQPAERIPTTYPLPNRPRVPIQGYEDEQ
ncbi:NADH-ubiquinone oxidoreductase 9.5 kDa subunit, partial [Thelephora ganbajun]